MAAIAGGPAWMSPAGLAEIKRATAEQCAKLKLARQQRLLIVPPNIEIMLGIAKVREINVGDRVRTVDGNEGRIELVLVGVNEGRVAVQIDRGPFAGSAYVIDGAKCAVIA